MKLSRRGFIKGMAVITSAAAGLGAKPALRAFAESEATAPVEKGGRWVASSCQGCTSWCSVEVYVEDGRAVKVRGNANSKASRGFICPRPHLALQQLYDPDRLKGPMKRTNPKKGRGEDPKFVPVSWEEALDMVADRLIALRKSGESHKFAFLKGRSTGLTDIFFGAIPGLIGSPNNYSHASICAEAEKLGAGVTEGYWDYRDYDVEHTRYFIMWSTDPIASNRQVANMINHYGGMRDRAKIAVIDPRLSATAAKCDEWLPVIPGEDGALALAMAHVILTEGLWHREFVGDFVDGKNRFAAKRKVEESAFAEHYTYGLVQWWNLELLDKTPEWAEKISGIPKEQIRRVARDFAAAAPHAVSWMSPGVAMQIRGGYSAMAANALNGLVGSVENVGGPNRAEAAPLGKLPGFAKYQDEIAKAGLKYPKIDQRGSLGFPAMEKGKIHKNVVTNRLADALLEKKPYEIKMAISYWNNWVFSCTGAQRWEKALAELPFFVHVTLNPAEMSQYADLVLPACHQMFERWGFLSNKQNMHTYVTLEQPVVEPLWDAKIDETEIAWMLAERFEKKGFPQLLAYYKNEFKDPETGKAPANEREFTLFATKLLTQPLWNPSVKKNGETIEGWKAFCGRGVWNANRMGYKKHWDDFGTKTKKFEFYSKTLQALLEEHAAAHQVSVDVVMENINYTARGERAFIPHYEAPVRYGDPAEYPLIFSEHRSRLNREGRSANTSWYQEFKDSDPGDEKWDDVLKLNPKDCREYGVKSGDRIRVTSVQGSIEVTVKEWEGTRPGVAVKCYGQGHWAYGRVAAADYQKKQPRGGNNNEILPCDWERMSSATSRHGGFARIKIERI